MTLAVPDGVTKTCAPAGRPELIHHAEGRTQGLTDMPSAAGEAHKVGIGRLCSTQMSVHGWTLNIIAEAGVGEAGQWGESHVVFDWDNRELTSIEL